MKKMNIRSIIAVILIAVIAGTTAYAATDYLEKYKSKVSDEAYEAAQEAKPPMKLKDEELSIYRLGFAAGYDQLGDFQQTKKTYILNKSTKKFHLPTCSSVEKIKAKNKITFTGTRSDVIKKGYSPCKNCNP